MLWLVLLLWAGYLAYLGLCNDDDKKQHLLWMWLALIAAGIALPLLGFR